MSLTGAILAGGRASRFGGAPKGFATVGGARIVDRVAEALGTVCDALLVVSNDARDGAWPAGARVVADVRPSLGALGGIHAALTHANGDVLVVAWDMPFVPASLLAELRDRARSVDVDAVVPCSDVGAEPLCALYRARCLTVTEALLDAGERRATALAESVRTAWLAAADVAPHGDPATLFLSVNTPHDLERALSLR